MAGQKITPPIPVWGLPDEFVNRLFGFYNQVISWGAGTTHTPKPQTGGPVTTIQTSYAVGFIILRHFRVKPKALMTCSRMLSHVSQSQPLFTSCFDWFMWRLPASFEIGPDKSLWFSFYDTQLKTSQVTTSCWSILAAWTAVITAFKS